MTIVFEMNGRKRKELVNAISEITGAKAVYKFMPTCAYEIGSYNVNKDGSLDTGDSEGTAVRELIAALADKGFACDKKCAKIKADTPTQPDKAAITKAEELSEESETVADTATLPDTAAITEAEEVSEESETAADTATQPGTAAKAESDGIDRFSISMRRDFFDEALFAKLDRLIESKSELFKMAFKTDDLSYEVTDDRVTFEWFSWAKIADEGIAYSTFIDMLTKHIKEQKRVNASKVQTENPKFAMRVFLIRLGMVGAEFKTTRKILLRNLEGSSAFRKGAPHNEDTK